MQTEPVLVRIHSQCLTGDIFESMLCDCGSQLHRAMAQVAEAGKGVVLYMPQKAGLSTFSLVMAAPGILMFGPQASLVTVDLQAEHVIFAGLDLLLARRSCP